MIKFKMDNPTKRILEIIGLKPLRMLENKRYNDFARVIKV